MSEARKRRMAIDNRSDGLYLSFYNEDGSDAGIIERDVSKLGKYAGYLAARGYADLLAQRISKFYGAECLEAEQKLWGQLASGEWSPDTVRPGAKPKEHTPSDLAIAIAKVQNVPLAHVEHVLENTLQTNEDGSPRVNAAGRNMRLFTDSYIHNEFLPAHPEVMTAMAQIQRERAKRLEAAAKANGEASAPTAHQSLGAMFGAVPHAAAAA